MKYLWKIGGEAGFGIMTTGLSFAKIVTRSGYHMSSYSEYPSLIRGGHNTFDVTLSDVEIEAGKTAIDLLVCLNKDTYIFHKDRLHEESIVVYDPADFDLTVEAADAKFTKVAVPFKELKLKFEVHQIMVNTIALGATIALLGADLTIFHDIINEEFGRKGQEIVDFNMKLAEAGFNHIQQKYPTVIKPILARRQEGDKMIMTGNDAFSFAAVVADCRYYAAYPMTPSSTVLTSLAAWQQKTGMVTRHSEDEIAVINSALGAAFSGVRSAVGTSGGGFALMVEALSYAGVAEIPVVVYMGQRPGPATGMPTFTEQGDLLFTVHAGHGEFPKIVLAPGDIYEMIELTAKAFDLADTYQTPVIVLSDKLLGESHQSEDKEKIMHFVNNYQPNYGKKVFETSQQPYLRYKLSEDGVSEWLVPGQKDIFYQANSYEHIEDSHTTEAAQPRKDQVEKRNRKWQTYLANEFKPPHVYGYMEASDIVFVSWGGNKGIIREAQKALADLGKHTSYIHFTHLYPMDSKMIQPLFEKPLRYILIENNSHAQFGQLLRMQTGIHLQERLLKYDGRPFTVEEIVDYVTNNKQFEVMDKLKKQF